MTHGLQEFCYDTVGNPQGVNNFLMDSRFTHYPVLNGRRLSGNGVTILQEYINNPIGYRPVPIDPRSYWGSIDNTAVKQQLAWRILSETNPSEPHVGVPAMLGELKDLPSLVQGWGKSLLHDIAQGVLTWRWAISPMISDLRAICSFVKAVDKRLEMLYALRDKRTLRRRCHLGEGRVSKVNYSSNYLMHSNGGGVKGERYESYTYKMWGSAQWKLLPDSPLPTMGFGPLRTLAIELAAGVNSHGALAAAWELTPWSWLIDWFSNVGDIISATNNSAGLTWSKICIMRESTSDIHAKPDKFQSDYWASPTGEYRCQRKLKERYVTAPVIPVPLPYLPIIDGGKWSILASLASLRLSRRILAY
jgi:hypothetical protein